MKKFIVSVVVAAAAFTSVASAKTKSFGTQMARGGSDYSTTVPSYSAYGAPQNEITTFLTRGFLTSEKRCNDCSSGTVVDVGAAYNYYLKDGFQVGGEAQLQILPKDYTGTGSSETLITLVGVGTYNFQNDLKNAFFAKAGIGLYPILKDNRDGYENKFGLFVGGGKRIQLMDSITYSPEIRLVKKGDLDMGIEIALINFSLFWN
ncbi:MAG: hypothetical protein ACM3MG_14190 [Bacillota bacterium]